MARKIKERKVFGLKGFRGLDTENKPLKVAPFRAVDGKNFIIDSETLKTRPAIEYVDTPLKNLDDTFIVDYYLYGDLYIYITNKSFVFKYKDKILSDITTPNVLTSIPSSRNFENYKPIFQEEKEVLFVFGLDNIYVISKMIDNDGIIEHVILYSINEKHINPFFETSSYFEPYNNLPIPYEPTLFIGDNALDDVNLLSGVSKYKLFSKSNHTTQEGTNLYFLPTHYNEEKNGEFPIVEVEFYKNKYGGLDIFPIFLGIQGETFEGNPIEYGELIVEEVELNNDFIAKEDFEYVMSGATPPVLTPIKEVIGLTKNDFFDMTVKENGQNVFEFMLDYINRNFNDLEDYDNQVFVFKMPYQKKVNYRDENDKLVKASVERDETNVYVQLKKKHIDGINFINKESFSSNVQEVEDNNSAWIDYPKDDVNYDVVENITPTPSFIKDFSLSSFVSMANNWLEVNRKNFVSNNNETLLLQARIYETYEVPGSSSYLHLEYSKEGDWFFSDTVEGYHTTPFPAYPEFNANLNPVVEISTPLTKSGKNTNADDFFDDVQNWLKNNMNDLDNDKNYGYVRFRWNSYYEVSPGEFREKKQSVVASFTYSKGSLAKTMYKRTSYNMSCKIIIGSNLIVEDLYELSFDKETNNFVFKCKDYFYDYNNEPPIDIKITFRKNPDYDIIASSKIGIPFGSENRLFLAGNKDYPNIDRFNVSNDLLGNNIKNQSYELSYFPSKNYRVLGGKGAINGYVLATDTQLYVTKEHYPNDSKLFIRNRTMDDNGIVGYNEFKTNIEVSPLNEQSVVRFYNDILVLDKKGLYGLELAQNVLTNERLIKLRSGFVNNDLVDTIKKCNVKPFIFEDNYYMYIIIGKTIYVADSRYIAQNQNGVIDNYSYEIVKWETHTEFKNMKYINGEKTFLDVEGKNIYKLVEGNSDEIADFKRFYMSSGNDTILNATRFYGENLKELLKDYKEVNFSFHNQKTYKLLAIKNVDYTVEEIDIKVFEFNIINAHAFRNVVEGDKIVFEHNGNFIVREVENFDEFERLNFIIRNVEEEELSNIYKNVSEEKLYPKIIFESWNSPGNKRVILSPYKEEVIFVEKEDYENENDYYEEINSHIGDSEYYKYYFENEGMKDTLIIREKKIRLEWVSSILDFGNNFSEKTMFKTNIYGTKQEKENWIKFGYRTMRRFNRFDREGNLVMMKNAGKDMEVSNNMDFDEIDFNLFSINTFNEFGSSLPTKENNFLYIQFLIIGDGNVELNSLEFLYKFNRMLKTIS